VSGTFLWLTKRQELSVQRMNIALKCAELKHQQVVVSQGWNITSGKAPADVDHWDPLMSIIDYMRGMRELERIGDWRKGRANATKTNIGTSGPGSV
jgi:hypothetical protein